MALLKQSSYKGGATACWSPMREYGTLMAVGTKGAASFDDLGAELQIIDTTTSVGGLTPTVRGEAIRTKEKFGSIAWGQSSSTSAGFIAGGMTGGSVELWDAGKVMESSGYAHVTSLKNHKDTVNALAFNPHPDRRHILASGSNDSEVNIVDLSNPRAPTTFFPSQDRSDKHRGPVRKLQWNTKVHFILASSSDDGSCVIWNLKNNKRWTTLSAPRGASFSDFAWHPREGLQILTAVNDDARPVVQVWDLRKSLTSPLGELRGHEKGLLSIDWCPEDPRLVVTSGSDGKTIVWDLTTGKPVYDLPQGGGSKNTPAVNAPVIASDSKSNDGDEGNFWENGAAAVPDSSYSSISNSRRITDLSWSPHMPLVMSACTFDNTVEVFNMSTAACNTKRPPKWLGRKSGATFGFGGRLATHVAGSKAVNVSTVGANSEVMKRTQAFEDGIATSDFRGICRSKSGDAATKNDSAVWDIMGILFEADARRQLLSYLGFDAASTDAVTNGTSIVASASATPSTAPPTASTESASSSSFVPPATTATATQESASNFFDSTASAGGISADDFFGDGPPLAAMETTPTPVPSIPDIREDASKQQEEETSKIAATTAAVARDTECDRQVKAAIMVGNFNAAVEKSLSKGNMADALLLAPFADDNVFSQARETYLREQMRTRPFMRAVLAILTKRIDLYVAESDLRKWKETLSLIASYAEQADFTGLCNALGDRLADADPSDPEGAAVVCYMCAYNGTKTVDMWETRVANLARSKGAEFGLQELIERLSVFQAALNESSSKDDSFSNRCVRHFTSYATLLAEQGRPDLALRCAKRFMVQNPSAAVPGGDLAEMVQRLEAMTIVASETTTTVAPAPAAYDSYNRNNYSHTGAPTAAPSVPAATGETWNTQTSYMKADGFGTTDVPGGGRKYGNTSYLAPTHATSAATGNGYAPHNLTRETLPNNHHASTAASPSVFDPSKASQTVTAPAPAPAPKMDPPKVLAPDLKPIVDSLKTAVARLKVSQLSNTEKRQMTLIETALQRLFEKLTNGAVEPSVCEQLKAFVGHVNTGNFNHAKYYYDQLASNAWKTNREWLKDLKWFVHLGKKKLQGQ